jgi:hypothetical protein
MMINILLTYAVCQMLELNKIRASAILNQICLVAADRLSIRIHLRLPADVQIKANTYDFRLKQSNTASETDSSCSEE